MNLGIAGFALYSNFTAEYAMKSGDELLEMKNKTQRLIFICFPAEASFSPLLDGWGLALTLKL